MADNSLHIIPKKRRFKAMIGTGGIGAGSLFLLNGNHTLGREESRGGKYLDARDYCKLHIIAHYVKLFCGEDFPVYPIGKVGDDDTGRRIVNEMEQAGLNIEYVHSSVGDKTLFGFCFIYPDGTGGNLTTEESACTKVDGTFIETAIPLFMNYRGSFISLAAPEVPLEARKRLLALSKEYQGFSVASFTSAEMQEPVTHEMLPLVDLLAINIEEAAAFLRSDLSAHKPGQVVRDTIAKVKGINPSAMLSITAGKTGSWAWDGSQLTHVPAFKVEVKSSAGAGDAHIAGIISGLTAGLALDESQELGGLAGAFAVTSPHTIHPDMSRENLMALALRSGKEIRAGLLGILKD